MLAHLLYQFFQIFVDRCLTSHGPIYFGIILKIKLYIEQRGPGKTFFVQGPAYSKGDSHRNDHALNCLGKILHVCYLYIAYLQEILRHVLHLVIACL